jgi:NAD(P)-dependent dehydrogenase (short-subunit alcohol dehydrogenase family)
VTGAAGAIGGATATALAEAGYAVAGHDRRQPSSELQCVLTGDLVGREREAVLEAEAALGGLDVLVHCAGGGDGAPFLEMSEELWAEVVDLNLNVAFGLCQEAARSMIKRSGGVIVLIGSLCGQQAWHGYAHYCAAKAGLEMLAKSVAAELGADGLRCNTIVPGTIDTPLTDAVMEGSESHQRLLERTPAGRLGTPNEVARVAVWLADAPEFLNGASIVIDGGYSIEGTP